MNQPLVSIIIPTYNRAHLIEETLDSILAQTYKKWECIIVDDGSSDGTALVVNKYLEKDKRFQFYNRPNYYKSGGNGARNYGFTLSKGEYIQWFDSDDVMAVEKIGLSIESLLKETADLVICKNNKRDVFFDNQLVNCKCIKSNVFYKDYITQRISILTGDIIFKKSVVEKFKFDENIFKAQEFEFFTRVFNQQLKIVFTESKLWFHRESPDSISAKAEKMNSKQLNSLIYLSKKLQKEYLNEEEIIFEAKRLGRKLYKSILLKKRISVFFNNYDFFTKSFNLNYVEMFLWFLYNIFTKKGFDKLKERAINN